MKNILLAFTLPLCAAQAAAQQLEYVSAEALKNSPMPFQAEVKPGLAAPAAGSARYYLDQNSYDPLLMRARRSGEKINVIGGTIDIPGVENTLDFARKYRQAEYRRHDLQSDVALTVYTKNLPKMLFQVLFGVIEDNGNPNGGTYTDINPVVQDPPVPMPTEADIMALDIPQDEKERMLVQLRNAKLQIEGRINPFRKTEMLSMIKQIMVEERANGLEPRFGEPHEWSPEFIQYCREKGELVPLGFTKLFTALASGVTARHFKTGAEETLINFILSRDEASVTMDQLFRRSYQLNRGDVYLTILTIENILGDNWRHPERDKLAVTRKLANISNFYQGKGDKYGAWYHFHGIMLYGYVRGGLRAALVGGIETAGSHVLNGANDQNEQQEDYVNSVGGKIGAKTAKIVNERLYDGFVPDKNYCDPNVYLDLSEDFRDRMEFVESKDFQVSLDEARMWLKPLSRSYLDCHLEIIYNDMSGELNSKYIVKRDHVNFKKGKHTPILINSVNELVKARAFISGCLAEETVVSNKGFGAAEFPARGVWVDAGR
ncbi:MAG: hypothetical protein A2049_13155 [Elusimicrobia bacterium GWA2_62_23]|nr:MAG: hypothetical protein A2049_13155 [Elusimicrobia bacterium GWA2_62_23]OGR72916.1 MAG: hypothetical protein A2179_04365 [Elusimicrobia bacterium GWC2_63_65]